MLEKKIKLGLPRGLLKEQTLQLFTKAGYELKIDERFYRAYIDDKEIEIFLARDQELTFYVEKGAIDAAIAQNAYIIDQKIEVDSITSFEYGVNSLTNAKIIIAVPQNSQIKTIKGLDGKKILSRVPNITKEYLKKKGIEANIEWTDRPAEPKVPLLGDAIVEFANTGSTIRAFNLRILETIMTSLPTLFMNKTSYQNKWKREKIENLGIILQGARLAEEMVAIMLHASSNILKETVKILPALKKPTVTPLRGEDWFDLCTVLKKRDLRELLPKLKELGCTDIVEVPINKVVL